MKNLGTILYENMFSEPASILNYFLYGNQKSYGHCLSGRRDTEVSHDLLYIMLRQLNKTQDMIHSDWIN